MKIDKRIIQYQDNQMSDAERSAFESELSKSTDLSRQLEAYKTALQSLNIDEQSFADKDYFVNLVPNFRKKLSVVNKPLKIKTAYALTAIAAVLVILLSIFNPFNLSEENSLDTLLSTLSENESTEILDYYYNDLSSLNTGQLSGTSDSLLTELISTELNLQETDLNTLVSTDEISIENVYSEIKSEEADRIYNEILNKQYF